MRSRRNTTRRLGASVLMALMVMVPGLGCGSDDESSTPTEAATEAATGATDTETRTLGEGIENLQEAQAQLCPELSDLSGDLTEISASGTEAGEDVLEGIASISEALTTSAAALTDAGNDEAASAAEGPLVHPGVAVRVRRRGRPGARRRGGRRDGEADGCHAVPMTRRFLIESCGVAPTQRRHEMYVLWTILFLVIWIAIAFWPARVAARKGHSFFLFFLFSLVFFPLALLVAYLVDDRGLATA